MIGNCARSDVSLWQDILADDDRNRREIGVKLANFPHLQQLGYALQLLTDAWQLRTVQVESARTADGEPASRAER